MIFGNRQLRHPRGQNGYRLYAIGDVHGCAGLLDQLLTLIQADHKERGGACGAVLVFLGDLIDRGPDSAKVLERVSCGPLEGFGTLALTGNHEEVLIRLLGGEEGGLIKQWLGFGGDALVQSYGQDPGRFEQLSEPEGLQALRSIIPERHVALLESMADTFTFGDYLLVHAGVRPGIRLRDQQPKDLRWIREPFLSDRRSHGKIIVHGHTISSIVDEQANRIGIDTGAYLTGTLSALGIEQDQRWVLQTHGGTAVP